MSTPIGYEHARAAASRFLSEPVEVYKESESRDESGGTTTTYRKPPLLYVSWVAAPSARRAAGGMADREAEEIASQVEHTRAVVCTLPAPADVSDGDLVRITSEGTWWKVTAEMSLNSPRAITRRVLLREIDPPHPGVLTEE